MLAVEIDGEAHKVAVLGKDIARVVALGEVLCIFLQVNEDARAARGIGSGFVQLITFLPIAHPLHRGGIRLPGAGGHFHLVCSHEHTVEAHTELADEVLRAALALLHGFQELLGAGVGDCAKELNDFLLGHTDAAIGNGESAGFLIGGNGDTKSAFGFVDISLGKLLEAQFLQCVRCVGNQLAHKDLAVAVECMNHNVQQLPDLRLELMRICHSCVFNEVCPYSTVPLHKIKRLLWQQKTGRHVSKI